MEVIVGSVKIQLKSTGGEEEEGKADEREKRTREIWSWENDRDGKEIDVRGY
jgi:hypothetical protein